MWQLSQPTAEVVRAHITTQRDLPFSYADVGASRDDRTPPGFVRDHNRERLGTGEATFVRARDAIRAWTMFPAPLARIEPSTAPIVAGEVVGVVIRAVGLWWIAPARIAYVIDEPRRFGFAYGTLPDHPERGEERFSVEWLADDSVWYDLLAFSQPRYWAARLGKPVTRALQKRFACMSRTAMLRAVAAP